MIELMATFSSLNYKRVATARHSTKISKLYITQFRKGKSLRGGALDPITSLLGLKHGGGLFDVFIDDLK